jgi:hypothetical protein
MKVVVDGVGTSEKYFRGQRKSKRNAIHVYRRIKFILALLHTFHFCIVIFSGYVVLLNPEHFVGLIWTDLERELRLISVMRSCCGFAFRLFIEEEKSLFLRSVHFSE